MNLYTKFEVSILIGEWPFAIPQYNLSLPTSIPNLKFLSYKVVEISLTKNLERKKKEQIEGRTNRKRPIFNSTIQLVVVNLYTKFEEIQLVVVNLYTKFEVSILNS